MLPTPDKMISPLQGMSEGRFGGKTYAQETVVTIGTSRADFIPNNPNRLFWIAINEGANDVRLSVDPSITPTTGWILAASGGVIAMLWEQDGESVGYQVYAIAAVAGNNVRVREVIRE